MNYETLLTLTAALLMLRRNADGKPAYEHPMDAMDEARYLLTLADAGNDFVRQYADFVRSRDAKDPAAA